MRTIGVVTVGRSDFGIYRPLLRRIEADPELRLHLIVSGMHLSPEFGRTVAAIREEGFTPGDQVEMLLSSDSPEGISKSSGLGVIGMAQSFARLRPDLLVVLGDRFEMHAAALAALPFKIPVAHLHGGEITQGAIDDALRHSITKLSHLHFVSTQAYARRVIQLGEEPWRVIVSGALSLDNLNDFPLLPRADLEARHNLCLEPPPLLVTFHPVTLEYEQAPWQADELLAALEASGLPVVFTLPNADTNGRVIIQKIRRYVQEHASARIVDNFGIQDFFSMMNIARAMVGNSSSGILEAASFGLPVVNIGTRQAGRLRASNVIDTGYHREQILAGIRQAVSDEFRLSLRGLQNPYGGGRAAEIILQHLKETPLDERLITKTFYDLPGPESAGEEDQA